MADQYEQAFAELQQTYIDLDGDGVPDVAVPAGADPMRAINRQFGPRTPQSRAGVRPAEIRASAGPQSPLAQVGNAVLDYGSLPAQAFVQQAGDTGKAISDFQSSGSLADFANMGLQGGLLVGRPLAGAAIAGGSLLEAARRDFMGDGSSQAQSFLTPDQRAELKAAQDRLAKGKFGSAAERRTLEASVNRLNDLDAGLAKDQAANVERQRAADAERRSTEDAAARGRANAAYAEGLATDRRFSDTAVGQVFDKLGPVAPGAVAAGTGLISGLGMRGMGVAAKGALYGVPMGAGTAAGAASAHWPMAYESMYAPNVNPSYQAALNYIREAPEGDPRAAQLKALITDGTLKEANPVRAQAERELYDPTKFAERSALGAIEGVVGGLAGGEAGPAIGQMIRSAPAAAYEIGRVPTRALRGMADGLRNPAAPPPKQPPTNPPPPSPSPYDGSGLLPVGSSGRASYPSEGTPARDYIRGEYADAVGATGKPLDAATVNRTLQQEAANEGYKLPGTKSRVDRINQRITNYVQRTGKMPTREQIMALYDNKTLAVPLAVGAGAAASGSPLLDLYGSGE
jgi:hypothetical protein